MSPACFPPAVSWPGAPFPPRGPSGRFPRFAGTIKALRLPAARPAALRCLRLAVPRSHSFVSLPRRTSAPPRAWSWSPGISGRDFAEETTGSPKFLGNPDCPFALFIDPGRTAGTRPLRCRDAASWYVNSDGSREEVFRRSIARLSDSLSTLRSAGHPATTQDSLPAAGQALPGGLSTRRVPMKGFRVAPTSHPPFPTSCRNVVGRSCSGLPDRRVQDAKNGGTLGRKTSARSHSFVPVQTQ